MLSLKITVDGAIYCEIDTRLLRVFRVSFYYSTRVLKSLLVPGLNQMPELTSFEGHNTRYSWCPPYFRVTNVPPQ